MEAAHKSIVEGTKDFFAKCGKSKAVIGISGGIDSALCANLLVDALGKENVTAVLMPHSSLTDDQNMKDAREFADQLGIKIHMVPIEGMVDLDVPWKPSEIAEMNTFSRIRSVVLYNLANTEDALVCGTSNRSEILLGYFTKFGDGAVDFEMIGELYKTEVYEMARFLGLPACFIGKKPTAELSKGQTDEQEIGATYEEIDSILRKRFDEGVDRITDIECEVVDRILALVEKNAHKRHMPMTMSAGMKRLLP